jgi:hypothetical protein
MSEHTPGPWRVEKFNDTKSWSIYANGGTHSLASIRDAANARLIAAAPDMLEALTNALGWMERYAGDTNDLSGELWRHISSARAAIAKAEDRS